MLRIGVLVGREASWPPAFIEEVNARGPDVVAEYVMLGGTTMNEPCDYAVLVDRISHEVPYYRSYLKNAVLQGARVVNNPFMWAADDKFFEASLAARLGIDGPRTVVLPNKDYVPAVVHNESLRNLKFPVPWLEHIDYLGGFPVMLKDAHAGAKSVTKVNNWSELWHAFNASGLRTMILQQYVEWDAYARVMCLGQRDFLVMHYDPINHEYAGHALSPDLHDRVVQICRMLVEALGYDMNSIELAIKDGVPYVIDCMNPAPDMDLYSLGEPRHRWCVTHMADMCIRLAKEPQPQGADMRWSRFLGGGPVAAPAAPDAAAAPAPAAKPKKPRAPRKKKDEG